MNNTIFSNLYVRTHHGSITVEKFLFIKLSLRLEKKFNYNWSTKRVRFKINILRLKNK